MKKKLMMALSLVLVAAMSIGGTVAYLTSQTGTVTNTFTVGNVAITLDEAKVTEMGAVEDTTRVTENDYKLIPGHTYTKDPTIHVTAGSEKCWLFVKVVDEIAAIQDETTIAAQMATNGWKQLTVDGKDVPNVYWHDAVDASEASSATDVDVFSSFKIKGNADVSTYEDKTITVVGYAVQYDGFDTADAAWKAAPSSWTATPTE